MIANGEDRSGCKHRSVVRGWVCLDCNARFAPAVAVHAAPPRAQDTQGGASGTKADPDATAPRYAVGDRVRSTGVALIGGAGVVEALDEPRYWVRSGGVLQNREGSQLEMAEHPKAPDVPTQRFKVGDRVRLVAAGNDGAVFSVLQVYQPPVRYKLSCGGDYPANQISLAQAVCAPDGTRCDWMKPVKEGSWCFCPSCGGRLKEAT